MHKTGINADRQTDGKRETQRQTQRNFGVRQT